MRREGEKNTVQLSRIRASIVFGKDSKRVANPNLARIENQIFLKVNVFRDQNGLPPLKSRLCLKRAAYLHSRNMANKNQASHVLDGLNNAARLRKLGIAFTAESENIHNYYETKISALSSMA